MTFYITPTELRVIFNTTVAKSLTKLCMQPLQYVILHQAVGALCTKRLGSPSQKQHAWIQHCAPIILKEADEHGSIVLLNV